MGRQLAKEASMAVDLTNHPGKNPEYDRLMAERQMLMAYNRTSAVKMPVPKQPNKYVPHIGAKQRPKGK